MTEKMSFGHPQQTKYDWWLLQPRKTIQGPENAGGGSTLGTRWQHSDPAGL